jgi:hypothetical protein
MGRSTGEGRTRREGANLQVRRTRIFDQWRGGALQKDIAAAFGVSIGTVAGDIKASLRAWREENRGSVGEAVERELDRLNQLELLAERECTAALDDEEKPDRSAAARFMEIMLKASHERRELLGLDAPKRTENKNETEVTLRTFKPKEEMQSIVAEALEKLRRQRVPSPN